MWSVYKHTTPNEKIYIGITHQDPKARWLNGNGYKTNNHFYNAIKKYGWNNIKHEIVSERLTQVEAETLERDLIFKYKSYDPKYGYNKALGGHALSEESRKKISDTRRKRGLTSWTLGKHLSKETREKIARANTGRHYTISKEGREHIAEAKRGNKNPNFGKPLSKERINQLSELNSKPVYQIIDGEKIYYKNAKEAASFTGVFAGNISRVCKGKRKTAGGFRWEYVQNI